MIGRVIGNYRIEALLGSGGMGAVYRALDLMLDRTVAIKALRADAAAQPRSVERFRLEARTLARLLHPNIATLYTLIREENDLYMVMEFCEGETFESILRRRGRLDPAEAVPLVTQALSGLEHAHRHGIVHRDIKPANLMRLPDGTVKVMDFGIARLLGSNRLTLADHTIGTAAYMAPEQVRAQDVDARADVYALGVLLYELVTGRVPFQSASVFEVMQAHIQQTPPPPRQFAPAVSEDLEATILRALAKNRADRFPSVAALREALELLDLPLPAPAPLAETIGDPIPAPEQVEAEDDQAGASSSSSTSDSKPRPAGTVPRDAPEPSAPRPPADSTPETRYAPYSPVTPTVALPLAKARRSSAVAPPISGSALAERTKVLGGRRVPRAAFVAGGVVLLAVGVWAFSPDSAPRGTLPAATTAPALQESGDGGAVLPPPSDGPRESSTDLASPAMIAAWVITASMHLDAGRLTQPPDSNALFFAERALSAVPGHAGAQDVVQQIVRQTYERGQQARQRGDRRAARERFQQAIAIADRHPGVADDTRASARLALSTVRSDEPVAQNQATGPPTPGPAEDRPPPEAERSATGTIRVLVRPFGDVFVDGQRRASGTNAPVFAEVAPGTHRIRVTHPTFGAQERTVQVTADRTAEVFIEFATPAQVTVVSDPINAEIMLDGRRTGRYTPATITIPPGSHTVEVRRNGYRPASRSVTNEAGQAPDRLAFTLTPES